MAIIRSKRFLLLFIALMFAMTACSQQADDKEPIAQMPDASTQTSDLIDRFTAQREAMVAVQMAQRDISNPQVLAAMRHVPRHLFVPEKRRKQAYDDRPLPIGSGQTISQPYIVALMTQLVEPQPEHRALDVGTGSGYQAAVLGQLVNEVYSIEIVPELATESKARLERLGYQNIVVREGDGYHGWKSKAPFDIIIVAAAPDRVPQALVDQLAPGGRMVIPVGTDYQNLLLIQKSNQGDVTQQEVAPVVFVPMTGAAER